MKSCAQSNDSKIAQLPFDRLLKEGQSQKNRVVKEVMAALFAQLPDSASGAPDFQLSDGTKCWVKKFYAPKKNNDDEWVYGFDVKFEEGQALAHLEFSVACSGWERVLAAPIPD